MTDAEILEMLSALDEEQFSEYYNHLKQLKESAVARPKEPLTA